ncbi:MAG: hypothetical protein ABI230_04290 [Aestuariivirga sp.]
MAFEAELNPTDPPADVEFDGLVVVALPEAEPPLDDVPSDVSAKAGTVKIETTANAATLTLRRAEKE